MSVERSEAASIAGQHSLEENTFKLQKTPAAQARHQQKLIKPSDFVSMTQKHEAIGKTGVVSKHSDTKMLLANKPDFKYSVQKQDGFLRSSQTQRVTRPVLESDVDGQDDVMGKDEGPLNTLLLERNVIDVLGPRSVERPAMDDDVEGQDDII